MASNCMLCNRKLQKSQPSRRFFYENHRCEYTVHAACLAHHKGVNEHLWDFRTLKRKT